MGTKFEYSLKDYYNDSIWSTKKDLEPELNG